MKQSFISWEGLCPSKQSLPMENERISTSSVVIPKIIMQTWKTNELPEKWKPTQTSISKYMPDWEYILMTDEMNRAFVAEYFPDFLSYYDAFPYPIQRADAVRYCWLYIKGGLYFDCDFELLGPLDELFTQTIELDNSDETNHACFTKNYDLFLLASSNTPNVITNGFMAAKPGNHIWLQMLEEMKKPAGFSSIERHLHVMTTTGPLAFNRVVKKSGISYKLLPSSKINPYTLCEKVYNKPNTLMRPLEGSSWVGGAASVYQWCYCQSNCIMIYGTILILIILILSLLYLMKYA